MRALKFSVPLAWTDILKRTAAEIYAGNCFAWAASLAYYFFLALFPALLFVISLASVLPVQQLTHRITTMLGHVAPDDVVAIARQQFAQITGRTSVGLLTLSLIGAIWSLSSGMAALVDTLNQAYRITERRPWWRVRLTAVVLTLALTTVTLIAFGLVMVGPIAAEHAANWLALGPLFVWIWNIVQWPTAGVLVITALGCVYHFAPDTSREWVWISPGSVTATALWLLISLAFKWYVSHFGDYQQTYGAIGGVMVTLLWFYFTSLAVLLGAQLDATIAHASPDHQPLPVAPVRTSASQSVPRDHSSPQPAGL
jgi:membrane protein